LLPDNLKSEALELERDLVTSSDTVISVSSSDAERFKNLGAKQSVVAPNGSLLPQPLADDAVTPHAHEYALFIGSAHHPNAEGYWDNFGVIPGFIPPSARLVVVGGVNNLLGQDARFQKFRELNNNIVHNMGVVSEDMLQLLLGFASVICLPIGSGGGTNLKTAEALLSGKPIIAMTAAFRGYEKFEDAPGVFVTDNSKEFKSLIQRFFQNQLDLGPKREADPSLTWNGTLEPLVKHYGAADQ
jgi:glycosyltransferase involved in cell wall biosynthesis